MTLHKLEIKGKFKLGQLVVTAGVSNLMAENEGFVKQVINSLKKHANCDWGDLGKEDKKENDFSLDKHLRILSAYDGIRKIWVITEADRSATTVLFPGEY